MLGENNIPQEEIKIFHVKDRKSYLDASPGERAAVTVAGPLANFVLAIFVYFYLAFVGTIQLSAYVGEVIPSSPAQMSGIAVKR